MGKDVYVSVVYGCVVDETWVDEILEDEWEDGNLEDTKYFSSNQRDQVYKIGSQQEFVLRWHNTNGYENTNFDAKGFWFLCGWESEFEVERGGHDNPHPIILPDVHALSIKFRDFDDVLPVPGFFMIKRFDV
jgi:hypothetical protein